MVEKKCLEIVCKVVCEKNENAKAAKFRGFFNEVVELQGIEPWSREDKCVRSTCLVDFNCRERQGRQRPKLLRSCCCLDSGVQHTTAQFCWSTPLIRYPQNRSTGRWWPARSYRSISLPNVSQIKQPWRKYFRHVNCESSVQSSTLMSLHADARIHTSCQNRSAPFNSSNR